MPVSPKANLRPVRHDTPIPFQSVQPFDNLDELPFHFLKTKKIATPRFEVAIFSIADDINRLSNPELLKQRPKQHHQ